MKSSPRTVGTCARAYSRNSSGALLLADIAEDYPAEVIDNIIDCYSLPESDRCIWNTRKMCTFFAHGLFAARAIWIESEFFAAWQSLLTPSEIVPTVEMLVGIALRETFSASEARLTYFPTTALPTEPLALFGALFAAKPRWLLTEMEPYLVAAARQLGLSAPIDLAIKYARVSGDPAERVITPLLAQ